MSFITRNVSHLIKDSSNFKKVRSVFGYRSHYRKSISPELLAHIINTDGPEEWKEITKIVMKKYHGREISKWEAQARLWRWANEVKQAQHEKWLAAEERKKAEGEI